MRIEYAYALSMLLWLIGYVQGYFKGSRDEADHFLKQYEELKRKNPDLKELTK